MSSRVVPWLIVALLLLACGSLIMLALHRESARSAEAAREQEARDLEAKGQLVALQRERDGLKQDLDAATQWLGSLQDALDAARASVPNAKPERVLRASTGPVTMDQEALRSLCAQIAPAPPASEHRPEPELMGEIRNATVELRTDKGNLVAAGAAEAWALNPERKLFGGKFEPKVSFLSEQKPPPADDLWPWWAHEAIGAGVGLLVGVMVAK